MRVQGGHLIDEHVVIPEASNSFTNHDGPEAMSYEMNWDSGGYRACDQPITHKKVGQKVAGRLTPSRFSIPEAGIVRFRGPIEGHDRLALTCERRCGTRTED